MASTILLTLCLLFPSPSLSTAASRGNSIARENDSEAECWKAYLLKQEAAGFSGAVLIARGDTIVFEKEFGPVSKDGRLTPFWIASISKAITATAVMKLVEDGLLDLRAPLSKYFPDAPQTYAAATVHQLLAHRSGLPHGYKADGVMDRAAAIRAILQQKPIRNQGEFFYSNDGYNLLAILIEVVAAESFESYVRSRIFKPAGMEGAGFWGFEPEKSAIAPLVDPRRTTRPTIRHQGRSVANWGYRGATGIYATAQDLFNFARAIADGRIIGKKAFAEMISSKNPALAPTAQSYGYGWAIRFKEGRLTEYWHGGNEDWLGHNGMLKVIGDRSYIILSNSGDLKDASWSSYIEAGLRTCEQR